MYKCKWCPEIIEQGEECTNCWEIRSRAEYNPKAALRIMKGLGIIPRNKSDIRERIIADLVKLGWKEDSARYFLNGE